MTRSNPQRVTLVLAFAVALPATIYLARSARGQIQDDKLGPPPPPSLAFSECSPKGIAQACEVPFTDGSKMSGQCAAFTDGRLFCRPANPPGPPPELLAACEKKVEGNACAGKLAETGFQGTCHQDISGRQICR